MKKKIPRGNCYVTCEALYHLLGGKNVGLVPMVVRHEGDTHWYLEYRSLSGEKIIIDPTVQQFKRRPDYKKGRGCGFLTKKPSRAARELMQIMLWQRND